jgi:DNA-directed RNA polymerase specialized sigma24 family protein
MKRQSDDQALTTLMQAAQAGDAQAYVRLLKEITPRLRQIVRRQRCFVKVEDIEDVVQDILLSLHAVRASYDPQRPFMPWLMAITRTGWSIGRGGMAGVWLTRCRLRMYP